MAQTAPDGYVSNYAAILDLIRFGFSVWTPSQMTALLFHAERSTAFGRGADQHSERQAVEGIYSPHQLRWVRGPSGLSKTTWHRVNGELEQTEKRPLGALRRIRRWNRFGKPDPTEYAIDWEAIRAAIEHWQASAGNLPAGWWEEWSLSQFGRVSLPIQESRSPKSGETQVEGQSTRIPLSQIGRDSQTDLVLSQSVSHSARAREASADPSAAAIAAAIEEASGERPTDRLTNTILETGKRLNLPIPVLVRWIHDKCFEVRGRGYPLRAGLLATAAPAELYGWVKSNQQFVAEAQRRAELQRQQASAAASVHEMPAAASKPDPEFSRDLLQEIASGRKARAV